MATQQNSEALRLFVAAASGAVLALVFERLWRQRRKPASCSQLCTLRDFECAARLALPRSHFEWIREGAADEITLCSNETSWSSKDIELMPRGAVDVSCIDTSTWILGSKLRLSWPVLVAPTSYQRLAHVAGELESARAAAAGDTIFIASMAMSHTSEDVAYAIDAVAEAAGHALRWQQLYFLNDKVKMMSFVRCVEEHGYSALVVTIDAAVGGLREHAARAGFTFPRDVMWANLGLWPANWNVSAAQVSCTATWRDIEQLCKETRLPVIVKGVMCGADAVTAAKCGAAGVIVSNHGGRQLDQCPSTASMLPFVCAALRAAGLEASCDVFVDGGIRRGSDVVKAVALGAKAVLIGRPIIWGIACGGYHGAVNVLDILKKELRTTMALCGCRSIEEVTSSVLARSHATCTNS